MLRQTLRTLARNPRFALLAILILSLGIGANTAMFSLVNGILLKPLAYHEPDRLVTLSEVPKFTNLYPSFPISAYYITEWRKHSRTIEDFALLTSTFRNLTGVGESERLYAVATGVSLFQMLGVNPQLGRAFLPGEDEQGKHRVAILSDGLWKRRFGADPNVLGSSIVLNENAHQVIGVMPAGFPFPKDEEMHRMIPMPERTDLWVPLTVRPEETRDLLNHNYAAIARLRPGVSIDNAQAELTQILRASEKIPKDFAVRIVAAPLRTEMVARVRQGLIVLMAAVGAVLLIVCVNITNLLLARGIGRRRELTVRGALGASRRDLSLLLLSESVVLSGLGAAGGVVLAYWLLDVIRLYLPVGLPRIDEVAIDGGALLFAALITLACTILCGLAPALRFSRSTVSDVLKDHARGSVSSRGAGRIRMGLIGCQVGMSVVLLVSAGLLIRSFARIAAIDQGFQSGNVFAAEVQLSGTGYREPLARAAFFRDVLERAGALPGVQSVGAASKLPLTGASNIRAIQAEGDQRPLREAPQAEYRTVTSGYFGTMRIAVLGGRVFDDRAEGPAVAVLGQRTAERIWPGQDPVGRRFRVGGEPELITVVGVVADVRSTVPNSDPPITVYQSMAQNTPGGMTLVLRTEGPEPSIRQVVKEVDPRIPLSKIAKVDEIVSASTAPRRFQLLVLSGFAVSALGLAALGIYGVVAFTVAQRRSELGLRMALGAQQRDIMGLVLRDGMKPVILGAIAGLACSVIATRLISTLLFGVTPLDALTYALAAVILLTIAAVACWMPARTAARIDPNTTLHSE